MTFRIVILGKRKDGMTHEECIEYLEHEHKPIVKQIPGLNRFTVSVPTDPDEAGYDELAELSFKSEEDLVSATDSEVWERAVEDAGHFVDLEETEMVTVEDGKVQYRPIPPDV